MKALTLKQPFAELVVSGRKKVELRKWNTKFRGEFLIHASKTPHVASMKKFGFENLPTGCIIGKAILKDVKIYSDGEEFNKDRDLHLASEGWGKYGFILENAERIDNVMCKGKL